MFKRSVVHEVDHEEGEDPQSPFIERSDSSEGSRRMRLEFVLPHWSRILIPGFVSNNKFILVTLIIMSAVAILALRRLVSSDMGQKYASDKHLSTPIFYNDYMVNTTSSESEFHLFYHVFSQNDDAERLKFVINEQVSALRHDGILKEAKAVHMTVVGTMLNRILSTMSPQDSYSGEDPIPGLDVRDPKFSLLTGYHEGSEEITLDAVRRHCLKRPNDIVLYMHSKGMYHPWSRNEKFRQNAMKGVANQCCLENLKSDNANVCGMRFCPDPHFHFPGNMFTARCDYIKELYPPKQLHSVRDKLAGLVYHKAKKKPEHAAGRFALEHWVGSHPALRAMDTLPTGNSVDEWYCSGGDEERLKALPDVDKWEPECTPAPRSGTGIVPFASNFFIDYLTPSDRITEYVATYGDNAKQRVSEEMYGYNLRKMDMDNYKQLLLSGTCHLYREEDAEDKNRMCSTAPCMYFTRGEELVLDDSNIQGDVASTWLVEWNKSKSALGCPKYCDTK